MITLVGSFIDPRSNLLLNLTELLGLASLKPVREVSMADVHTLIQEIFGQVFALVDSGFFLDEYISSVDSGVYSDGGISLNSKAL